MISKDCTNVQLHKKFTKSGDHIYRDVNWIQINNYYLCLMWVYYNLLVGGFDMSKIVHSFPKTIISKKFKFWWVHNNALLECDNFVFRKVNWPLSLRRGEWVVFSLMAKLPLGVRKPNCQCSLISIRALF